MSALNKIIAAGFTLAMDGNDLVIKPFSKLTPNQRAFLKSHKAEIVAELKQQQAGNDADTFDDRHYCHECTRLVNGRCVVQRFKPTDDIPRRCADFVVRVLL